MQKSGGHFFLPENTIFPPNNRVVYNTVQIIKAVMLSTAKAELGTLYIYAKQSTPLHQMLCKLGHPQSPMPIQTDNSMAYGIIINKIIPKGTKAMDMQFHWLHNCMQQQQFPYYRWPRKMNYTVY